MAKPKNSEAVILATKWLSGQPNNDAEKIRALGFHSPDLALSYAFAKHIHTREIIYFASQNRYERWLLQQENPHMYHITVREPVRQIV